MVACVTLPPFSHEVQMLFEKRAAVPDPILSDPTINCNLFTLEKGFLCFPCEVLRPQSGCLPEQKEALAGLAPVWKKNPSMVS